MDRHICTTCGTRFPLSEHPPDRCPICADDRQYVSPAGQRWTTMEHLARDHRNRVEPLEPGLFGIGSDPQVALGQRALLVQTPEGNILWDCITLFDDETKRRVDALGGLRAIAISHPHYYSSMGAWAQAFDVPIHVHDAERPWVMDREAPVRFWAGDRLDLFGGLTLHRLGGHFEGSQVLHWPAGAGGRGALLSGDTVYVAADPRWVSFMHSFPNYVPLPAPEVRRIGERLAEIEFARVYGAWWDRVVQEDGRGAVQRSVARYLEAVSPRPEPEEVAWSAR